MRKPRDLETSADIKRSPEDAPARPRRTPRDKAAPREEPAASSPKKPRPRADRVAVSRARAGRETPKKLAPPRAAKARTRAAAPRRRTVKSDAPTRPLPKERSRAAEGKGVVCFRTAAVTEPPPRAPELDWDDAPRSGSHDALLRRWTAKAEELLAALAAHGASRHEYRADLKEGRFLWLAPSGRVSGEARALVLCSFSRATSVVTMAWSDPLVRSVGIDRIDGMPPELDDVDEEGAWRVAMEAAEASGAAYLYRVSAPHGWYFLGLSDLTFTPERASFHPGTPVALLLRALSDVRDAIESRAEPANIVRRRLRALGRSLFHQAKYAYRGTDWVARLDRTGTRLMYLAGRIPRASYSAVAAGQPVYEWIERDLAIELIESIGLLEDEWSLFS